MINSKLRFPFYPIRVTKVPLWYAKNEKMPGTLLLEWHHGEQHVVKVASPTYSPTLPTTTTGLKVLNLALVNKPTMFSPILHYIVMLNCVFKMMLTSLINYFMLVYICDFIRYLRETVVINLCTYT